MNLELADYTAILPAPSFALGVRIDGDVITRIDFLPATRAARASKAHVVRALEAQLADYLANPRATFKLPLAPAGTAFQRRVWAAISAIPPGAPATYGALAAHLGSAPRAVGQACGANPYPIVVPCHRVVGARHLGGFAHHDGGFLLDIKRWLLDFESAR